MGALLATGFGLLMLLTRLGQGFTNLSYDLPFTLRPHLAAGGAAIVYIDEESYQVLGQRYHQWDRSLHAELVRGLEQAGARLVVFDVYFADDTTNNTAANRQMAQAFRESGKVVLAAEHEESIQAGVSMKRTIPPASLFRDAAAAWGIARVWRDADFGVRQHYPGAAPYPSLAWKAAALAGADVTLDDSQTFRPRWLNYYGPPDTLPGISYHRVVRGEIPEGFVRDKVVFVGARPLAGYAGELKEEFRNPYTWSNHRFSAGVEIHALTFLNLIRRDWLVAVPSAGEIILIVLCGIALGFGFAALRPIPAIAAAVLLAVLTGMAACLLMWQFRLWFSWMIIAAVQIPVALAWTLGLDTFRLYIEKRLLQHSLSLHLAPARVKQLLKRADLRRPGGDEQMISILFSDIYHFATITARMPPDDLIRLLNRYFEASLAAIHRHHGTVIKLAGDGIFAIWNAPLPQTEHQKLACLAALDLRDQLIQFDIQQGSLPLRTRVGLHTGMACVGNIGSRTRIDYTAIGSSVNLASRLEGLNKHLGTDVLATRSIQKAVENIILSRPLGFFRLKGIDEVIEVYELRMKAPIAESPDEALAVFKQGLKHFHRREFRDAQSAFRRVLEIVPRDGPAAFYLDQAAELDRRPPPPDWMGEIQIHEK